MSSFPSSLPENLESSLRTAIHQVRRKIYWKPGKDEAHLTKRITRGHVKPETTLAEYETIIRTILTDSDAVVYVFQFGKTYYPVIVAMYQDRLWLVMFGLDGIMETAFPPDEPDSYFQDPKYHLIGPIREITP